MSDHKDNWDRFDITSKFVVSVLIASIAGAYTWSQNALEKQRQAKSVEVETLSKFMPYLTGSDEHSKKAALLAIQHIASTEFMTDVAQLFPSQGSVGALQAVVDSPISTTNEIKSALAATKLIASAAPNLRGKALSFGSRGSGADDTDIPYGETLALVKPEDLKKQDVSPYFLPAQPPNTKGLMARLDPHSNYIACRYDPAILNYLRSNLVTVRSVSNPAYCERAKVVEMGPPRRPEYDGYIAAVSPELARKLQIKKGDEIEISFESN